MTETMAEPAEVSHTMLYGCHVQANGSRHSSKTVRTKAHCRAA